MTTQQSIADSEARGAGESRWERATHLYEDGYFARISADVFIVQMPGNPGEHEAHTVNLDAHTCNCKDFDFHRHLELFSCYHIIAARMYQQWLRRSVRRMAYLFGEEA